MRSVLILLVVGFFSHSALSQQQDLDRDQQQASSSEQPAIDQNDQEKSGKILLFSDEKVHIYTCQRCGSENQLQWSAAGNLKSDELVPHCDFCGKKYWPKFKPANSVPRMYCALPAETTSTRF